jgi:hypothetical protein
MSRVATQTFSRKLIRRKRFLRTAKLCPHGRSPGDGGRMLWEADRLALEVETAPIEELDSIYKKACASYSEDKLTEPEWEGLLEQIQERKQRAKPKPTKPAPRRRPISPDRARSRERRRREASSGLMPPAISALFTEGERAALSVIASEIRRRGRCDLLIDQVAAYSGTSRSTVKRALRQGRRLGLLDVQEWKQAPDWNGPNCITIVDKAWASWLAKRPPRVEMTVQAQTTTRNQNINHRNFPRGEGAQKGYPREVRASAVPRAAE